MPIDILRMRELPVSTTYTFPALSDVMPFNAVLNLENTPTSLLSPAVVLKYVPPPAYVVTLVVPPVITIFLTRLFPVSVTYILLVVSIVILVGLLNLAVAPGPSSKPVVVVLLPANTVISPLLTTNLLMQLLALSTIYRLL